MTQAHGEMNSTLQLAAQLRESCGQVGQDAAALIEWFLDERAALLDKLEGAVYFVRKDADDNLGVVYLHPDMIGHSVNVRALSGKR